jgi:hypothetical protein
MGGLQLSARRALTPSGVVTKGPVAGDRDWIAPIRWAPGHSRSSRVALSAYVVSVDRWALVEGLQDLLR